MTEESLIPPEIRQLLMAAYGTTVIENEDVSTTLEARGQLPLLRKVAENYAASQIEAMEHLGAKYGLDDLIREVAIETKSAPIPRFWTAWKCMTDSLHYHGPSEDRHWLPNGVLALPAPPSEATLRDLAAREPLPPPPPPPPGLSALEVQGIVSAAVAAAVSRPEATVSTVEQIDDKGKVFKKSTVRTTRKTTA